MLAETLRSVHRVWNSGQTPRPETEIEEPTGQKQEGMGVAVVSRDGGRGEESAPGAGPLLGSVWEGGRWRHRGQPAKLHESQVLFYHF